MSRFYSAFAALLLTASCLLAQLPPAQSTLPQAPPQDPKLEELLFQWEKVMTNVQSLVAYCTRTTVDKVWQTTEVYEGSAKFLKSPLPNQSSRASLEMFKKGKPEVFEKYVCSGTFLYEYAPANKVIRVHELPPPKQGQISDDNFLSFLFGMKAVEAKNRYNLTYVPPNDKWYYYLEVTPRSASDKADFTKARLVLTASTYLPRQLWFEQPNGNQVTWDFPKVVNNAEQNAAAFAQPDLPPGWQFVRVPRDTQARIIRQGK